ncbi:DUF547 domain-containing protein [Ekhidna sp.]|uniref:DUF547 domain-containing protein n=1 Tax=Ekhidna sp. TaxID=2608089 RepID=UPI003B513B14
MRSLILIYSLLIVSPSFGQKADTATLFDEFNQFLLEKVVFGLVDYEGLKQDPQRLNDLVDNIASYDLRSASQDHRTAFFINTYNILVIKQIVDNYPVDSPMDIKGFFKIQTFTVANETLTLDQIEFSKLFAETKDPRIHFALGCGARSCPYLYENAFYPVKLQEQLEFRAQLIIDRPNYVYVDEAKKTVLLNKIFDWYTDQFVDNAGSLINYVNKYRYSKVAKDYQITFQEYDWSLNGQ